VISLLKYLTGYRKEAFLAPFFKLLEALFDLLAPLVVAWMIDKGIAAKNREVAVEAFWLLVGLACVGFAIAAVAQYYAAKVAATFTSRVRRAAFSRVQRFSYSQLDRFGADSIATRLGYDANQMQTGLNLALRLALRSPIVVFGAIVMSFFVDVYGALVFLGVFLPLALVVFAVVVKSIPLNAESQRRLDAAALAARENIDGLRVVRAFNMESHEKSRFETLLARLYETQQKAAVVAGLMNPATYLIVNLGLVGLIYTGAARIQIGAATQGETVALVNYMSQILVELVKLANLLVQTNRAVVCSRRLAEVINEPEDMVEGTLELPESAGPDDVAVSFQNVSLTYPGAAGKALDGISFDVKVGQTVGIVGGVGAGKTSLANLIPRFYDATEGTVQVFGRDVREYRFASLRSAFGIAPQVAELFEGTVASNLRWGAENATDEDLYAALEIAQATDFVPATPEGLAQKVEARGRNLSGGQRRRLTIARALVRRPRVLILDDASASLDYGTDARLRAALREARAGTTTFIVAQRVVATMDADLILVLDEGRLVGLGNHETLLRENDAYREIYNTQFPDDEKGGAKR